MKDLPGTKEPKTKQEIEEALALQDYPLNEALNLLKGINIVKKPAGPPAQKAK